MHDQPFFLTFLGVPGDADERTIRRAYATLLKRIDQASEADKFQALREAYEAALRWVREQPETQAPAVPQYGPAALPVRLRQPVEAPPAAPVPPGVAAAAALADFLAQCAALRTDECPAMQDEIDLLEAALAGEALIDLDVGAHFEMALATYLVQGWQPGNEVLFYAASQVLGWREDRIHALRLGGIGTVLNRAVEEDMHFHQQQPDAVSAQYEVLARLREPELPDDGYMLRAFPHFEKLVHFLPHWLGIVAPYPHVDRWREHYANVLQQAAGSSFGRVQENPQPELWERLVKPIATLVVLALFTVFLLMRTFPQTTGQVAETLGPGRYTDNATLPEPSAELPEDLKQQVYSRIRYAGTAKLTQGVSFQIDIDRNGRIVMLRNGTSSGDPGFDAAVARALTASQPFPSTLPTHLYIVVEPGRVPDPASNP